MRKLSDINIRNKTIALRVDLNVPVDKFIVLDESRIAAILPTIKYLQEKKCKILILSHFGLNHFFCYLSDLYKLVHLLWNNTD